MIALDSERLNKWLTQFANIGVLVGLAVLIFEIRQNNELTMAQIEQSRSESYLNWQEQKVLNDHYAPLIAKVEQLVASQKFDEPYSQLGALDRQSRSAKVLELLDPIDRVRLEGFITRDYWDYENLYFQYKRGLVSESYWEDRIVPGVIDNAPRWKAAMGDDRLPSGRPAFNAEVERLLRADE